MTNAPQLQLAYALATEPFPLIASPPSGPLSSYTVMVQVWNPTPATPVELAALEVTLPIGEADSDLTDTAPTKVAPPSGWKLSSTPAVGVYVFEPPSAVPVGTGLLTFVFEDVQVNRVSGPNPVTIEIEEGSGGCAPGACPTTTLQATKWPYNFAAVDFYAKPDNISAGQPTTLNWSGSQGAAYSLDYAVDGKPVHEAGLAAKGSQQVTPDATTTYSLTVAETIEGTPYSSHAQVTVTVQPPPPSISHFSGGVSYGPEGECILTFDWEAAHAPGGCTLTGLSGLQPASSKLAAKNTITLTDPGQGTFVLTAMNADESLTATSTLTLGWAPQALLFFQAANASAIAVSSDGKVLYVTGNTPGEPPSLLACETTPATAPLRSCAVGGNAWPVAIAVAPGGPPYTVWTMQYGLSAPGTGLAQWIDDPAAGTFQFVQTTQLDPASAEGGAIGVGPGGSPVYFSVWGGSEPQAIGALEVSPPSMVNAALPAGVPAGEVAFGVAKGTGTVYLTSSGTSYSLTPGTAPLLSPAGSAQVGSVGVGCDVAGEVVFAAESQAMHVLDRSLAPRRDPIPLAAGAATSTAVSPDGMRLYVLTVWSYPQWQVNVYTPSALTGGTP